MSIESILGALTHSEKLDAMDLLWRDLSRDPLKYASPEWHQEVLANRLAKPADGARLPLADAVREVTEGLNARRTEG